MAVANARAIAAICTGVNRFRCWIWSATMNMADMLITAPNRWTVASVDAIALSPLGSSSRSVSGRATKLRKVTAARSPINAALVITRSRHGTGTPSPQASDTVIAPTAQSNTALRRVRRPVPFHSSAAADQTATPATTAASAHQTTLTTPAKTVRSSRYPARGSTREVRAEGCFASAHRKPDTNRKSEPHRKAAYLTVTPPRLSPPGSGFGCARGLQAPTTCARQRG